MNKKLLPPLRGRNTRALDATPCYICIDSVSNIISSL